jgi:hypothetical protein
VLSQLQAAKLTPVPGATVTSETSESDRAAVQRNQLPESVHMTRCKVLLQTLEQFAKM